MSNSADSVPSFQGPFHFVHHDKANMKTLPHRKAVFSHIQSKYRPWRHKNKIQHLQPWATLADKRDKVPLRSTHAKVQTSSASNRGQLTPKQKNAVLSGRNTYSIQPRPTANIGKKISRAGPSLLEETPSPCTLVQNGQSDPFNAYAIKIDARVNQIMTFYRDEVMPLLFDGPAFGEAKKLNWKYILEGLEVPGAAFCNLARNSAAAAIVAPSTELAKQTYLYQAKSTKMLREHLNNESIILSQRTILWIFTLFDAEVMARNLSGALAHGRILVRSLELQSQKEPVNLMTLVNIFFCDLNLACTFLIRPLFDYQEWMPRMFRPLFEATESKLPPALLETSTGTLDPSIRDEKLLTIFKQRRQSDFIRGLMFKGTQELPLTLTVWITVRSMLNVSGLLNLYLDYAAIFESSLHPLQESIVQAYLTLATLFLVRLQRYNKILHGVRLYESGLQMGAELRRLLNKELTCPDYSPDRFRNARLWTLYVGALAEQMPLRDRPNPTTAWFNVNFATQACRMGLFSWDNVREILGQFNYDNNMRPHGSEWFFKSLASVLETSSQETLGS